MFGKLLITAVCVMIVCSGMFLKPALPQQVDFRVNNLENDGENFNYDESNLSKEEKKEYSSSLVWISA